jgi:hypothetical protein
MGEVEALALVGNSFLLALALLGVGMCRVAKLADRNEETPQVMLWRAPASTAKPRASWTLAYRALRPAPRRAREAASRFAPFESGALPRRTDRLQVAALRSSELAGRW